MKYNGKIIGRLMRGYSLTFMAIELADLITLLVDGLVVSRGVGAQGLAAIGMSSAAIRMVCLLCSLPILGLQALCTEAMCAGDREKNDRIFSEGCTLTMILMVSVTALGFALRYPICSLIGAGPAEPMLRENVYRYLSGWFVGLPGYMGFMILSPVVTLDNNKKLVTLATVTQSTINILGDFLTIRFHFGVYGIGFASGFGFDVAFLLLLSSFVRKQTMFHYHPRMIRRDTLSEIGKIGTPGVTKYICKMLCDTLINRVVVSVGGVAAMSAYTIMDNLGGIFNVAGKGIASSVKVMTQVLINEKDREALHIMALTALRIEVLCTAALAAVLFLFAPQMAGMYLAADDATFGIAVHALRCMALGLTANGIGQCIQSYLQGARKSREANGFTICFLLAFKVLLMNLLGDIVGTVGMFAAIPAADGLVLAVYGLYTLLCAEKGEKRGDRLLLLPSGFGDPEENCLSFSVKDVDEVVQVSRRTSEFLESHGIGGKQAFYASLCLEEMADNVVTHGFPKSQGSNSCDIRVIIRGDEIILRIRDDCRYFNIGDRYAQMDKADRFANIGTRLVYGIASEVTYIRLLETNTLIIRLNKTGNRAA